MEGRSFLYGWAASRCPGSRGGALDLRGQFVEHVVPTGSAVAGALGEGRPVKTSIAMKLRIRFEGNIGAPQLSGQSRKQVELRDRRRGDLPDAVQLPLLTDHQLDDPRHLYRR